MTDVLLFNQYFTSKKDRSQIILATLPINLLCVASYLKKKNIKSKIYDLGIFKAEDVLEKDDRIRCGISDDKIIDIIQKENPKVIGLGCSYSRHYIDVIAISKLIKQIDPSIQVVLGGNHSTVFYDMVLKEDSIDFVVIGEGEITFYELCSMILSDFAQYKNVDGIAFCDESEGIVKTKKRELAKDLSDFPMDYSLLDIRKYATVSHGSPFFMRYPVMGIVSSRGCPGKCVYCTVKSAWGRSWRSKTAEKTVEEIELLHNKYGIQEFAFLDDSASLDKKRWIEICDEIISRKLDIRWTTPNGIAHWTLDEQILDKMKKAGCYRVTFGIESGNPETRKFLGKPYSLDQAKSMIQYANKIGMWTICTNILGFPYEKKESMDDTLEFAKKCGTDFAAFYTLAPHVASDVYDYFKKEDLLNFDSIFNDGIFNENKYEEMNRILDDEGVPTKHFTADEIKQIQIKAYKSFIFYRALTFLNPMRILSKIHSWEDFRYTIKLLMTGVQIFLKSFYKKTTKALLYE